MIKEVLLTPFQKFIRIESLSGILLLGATVLAMLWANSPWSESYTALWEYQIGINSEHFSLTKPLILWINDGLMAIFFFLIGLEIKRELLLGELNTMRKAALPMFAAVGGALVPVAIFLLLNNNPEARAGWGIPMATDIAFTLAIIKMLGDRVPLNLKIFLTAFAIVDDLGAVLVIAFFYSSGIKFGLIAIAFGLLLILAFLASRGVYLRYFIVAVGAIIWYLFLKAGVHPTIAGVLLAFTIPIRQRMSVSVFIDKLSVVIQRISTAPGTSKPIMTREQLQQVDELESLTERVYSPLQHLEYKLHDLVAYFIIPVFALANAGVVISTDLQLDPTLIMHIALAMIVGKCVGITALSLLGIRLGFAELPAGVSYRQVVGVAILAGVGFTMSIFIANLAFPGESLLIDSAKVGILAGSVLSGLIGYLVLRTAPKPATA
ncbi:MAG: Na+/H+ antiporter NhaA [Saprospiraceae bacterium]|nr:Na+/H+ antiporter NhaA [Saprospiraceae bacterium]